MKKYFLLLFGVVLSLSGCTTTSSYTSGSNARPIAQGSGVEFEKMASGGLVGMFSKKKSVVVDAPMTTVEARLSQFASQCVDGKAVRAVDYGRHGGTSDTYYRAKMTNEDGTKRLVILFDFDNGALVIGGKKGYKAALSTQILPDGSETKLNSTYFVRMAGLYDAVEEWASGKTQTCPDLTRVAN